MERHNLPKERLVVPTDFASPSFSRINQQDLVPPSHFTSTVQFAGPQGGIQLPETTPPTSWRNTNKTSVPSEDPSPTNQWLAISQAQQEILELRKENQRMMMLREESRRGRIPVTHPSESSGRGTERREQWSRWDLEWCLETEKHKAEVERLKGQVEALKDTAERHWQEMRDKDSTMNRQSHDLEAMREELYKAKDDLSQMKEELIHSSSQKEKISSQLERLKGESAEQITKLKRDLERSKEEAQELVLKAEMGRVQTEEEFKQQTLKMSQQLQEIHKKQENELQQLSAFHHAELGAARKANGELQDRLQSITSEVLQLKSSLMEVSTERDGLREGLSQMRQAFETQSATLHSLRNYIGQLAPENSEKEQLNDAVERLNQEKAALQVTTELLTVRLNSMNEIVALQEEELVKKALADPLMKNGSEGLQVLQRWREKVYKLCVQLRSKDIEIRGERDQLLSKVRSMEQQFQQEQHRASMLKHSLNDRIAELDLQRVENETFKQDLFQARKENSQLKVQNQKAEAELKTLSDAVHRLSLAFESKVAELFATQTRLISLTQRLAFANGRVETIQGLIMRRVALQKVQQASKQAEQTADSFTNLRTELSLVCDERDKLKQELKRTPELIDQALADLKDQYEGKLNQQQQQLEQSWTEAFQAVADKDEAEQSLLQIQAQLEESKVNMDKLHSEWLSQQELSEHALQERMSEIEDRCANKLREMEVQVNTAKREHTKAVMTLRQFERDAARKQNEMREHLGRGVQNKQPKENEKDECLLMTAAAERGPTNEYTRAALQISSPPQDISCAVGAKVANERLFSVLEELHSLCAAVVNNSEDSEEEEGQNDSVGESADPQTIHTADT
ncbi:coiled-coil alpha-helical rod protein 1 isoform X2 [Antennarius striatus]|uniref:coiled-coil alpha-helical rod protein 1 isoform X2 n=1 Tax=Antennarius striatus TaxID=241820 RepID=UPI0035AFFBF7